MRGRTMMRTSAWRGPLVGALAAILLSAGAARADLPDLNGEPSVDFGQAADGDDAVHDWTVSLFYGYETFRGISDGNWQNNGLNTGFNVGTRLGQFSDWTGIGFQAGGSIG